MAALIVITAALSGAFVGLPAAASAAVTDDTTGGSSIYGSTSTTIPAGPAVPPVGETAGGTGPTLPRRTTRDDPPRQGSSWTVPQPIAHVVSTVGDVLSGTVDGLPAEGSSWT